MIRPPVSSISTRDAVAPAVRKNRRRSAPDTSTTSPPDRALERVHPLTRLLLARGQVALDHDPQVPHRVAARQLAQPWIGGQSTHEPHLVDGLRLILDQVGALDLLC